jgi:transcriptional regulator with XRE-family HTH domain
MTGAQAQQLGQLIARARTRKQLTYRALDKLAGVNYVWIVRLERGEFRNPAPDRLGRLAEALDINPERLDRISHGHLSDSLPEVRTYFRAKYDLSPDEISRVERLVRRLRSEHGEGHGAKG